MESGRGRGRRGNRAGVRMSAKKNRLLTNFFVCLRSGRRRARRRQAALVRKTIIIYEADYFWRPPPIFCFTKRTIFSGRFSNFLRSGRFLAAVFRFLKFFLRSGRRRIVALHRLQIIIGSMEIRNRADRPRIVRQFGLPPQQRTLLFVIRSCLNQKTINKSQLFSNFQTKQKLSNQLNTVSLKFF